MNSLAPAPREQASCGTLTASGEKAAVRPDEGTVRRPVPQLISMRELTAWWERENFIARGAR